MTYSSWESPRDKLLRFARAAEQTTKYEVRHKCFLSYAAQDLDEVTAFVGTFGATFIPRVIGVSEDDPFVDSDNDSYVLGQIQQKYLWDSTVTIVLMGKCTWSRRFVDWEIYSSLRDGGVNNRNGVMAIQLPSVDGTAVGLPDRLRDNIPSDGSDAYARYYRHPTSESGLRTWIHDAFTARTTRSDLIDNSRNRRRNNSSC